MSSTYLSFISILEKYSQISFAIAILYIDRKTSLEILFNFLIDHLYNISCFEISLGNFRKKNFPHFIRSEAIIRSGSNVPRRSSMNVHSGCNDRYNRLRQDLVFMEKLKLFWIILKTIDFSRLIKVYFYQLTLYTSLRALSALLDSVIIDLT